MKIEEETDGLKAWGMLHAKYSTRTLTRLMRIQQECMYPKQVKMQEVGTEVMVWEDKWVKMLKDQPPDTKIPTLWKMAALLKLCPKELQDQVDLIWDEIGEKYEVLKEKIIGWSKSRAEKKGGAVPMDIDAADEDNEDWGEDDWDVDAVYPGTKCYFCQGFGHMARECPMKGKGKGKTEGGKGGEKGKGGYGGYGGYGGKGYKGKGAWDTKGVGKKGAKSGETGSKGGGKGKGFGYQGTCFKCGVVGHKSNECDWWVQSAEEEEVVPKNEDGKKGDVGGVCEVSGVDVVRGMVHQIEEKVTKNKKTMVRFIKPKNCPEECTGGCHN